MNVPRAIDGNARARVVPGAARASRPGHVSRAIHFREKNVAAARVRQRERSKCRGSCERAGHVNIPGGVEIRIGARVNAGAGLLARDQEILSDAGIHHQRRCGARDRPGTIPHLHLVTSRV